MSDLRKGFKRGEQKSKKWQKARMCTSITGLGAFRGDGKEVVQWF